MEGFLQLPRPKCTQANFPGASARTTSEITSVARRRADLERQALLLYRRRAQKQDGIEPVSVAPPFDGLNGGFNSPFFDTELTGKLDWHARKNIHVFIVSHLTGIFRRATYYSDYSVYSSNRDNAPSEAARPGLAAREAGPIASASVISSSTTRSWVPHKAPHLQSRSQW